MFISFEGGDGSGKTTQATLLYQNMVKAGMDVLMVHEPGSTPLGWHLRDFLKSKQPLTREGELLLFEAARAELVVSTIIPALEHNRIVISDRYEASTLAYQGYGRKLDLHVIRLMNEVATQGIYPDLTFWLDINPEEGLGRREHPKAVTVVAEDPPPVHFPGYQGGTAHGTLDLSDNEQRRFEDMAVGFHHAVREGYSSLSIAAPERWRRLNGSLPVDILEQAVWYGVREFMGWDMPQ